MNGQTKQKRFKGGTLRQPDHLLEEKRFRKKWKDDKKGPAVFQLETEIKLFSSQQQHSFNKFYISICTISDEFYNPVELLLQKETCVMRTTKTTKATTTGAAAATAAAVAT
ncbi:hypothetical protein RUM43_008277 [Polyplax serrata]|uniref:Uncharacterized protein n=1 Tax=Polyplax serrata TaxID=468196 RepID=A0AAN8P6U2_POLSC